uniref:G-protein coupled receptors family 1 profile domain-containing protein n=1 Tax=Amphiprion ocellaris TaxID=80972 RepID=A0AAQ6A412_AMPOC
MSVSMVTDTYPSTHWSVAPEAPAGTNATNWKRDALLAVAEVVVLAVILVMALLGNGLVLVVLLRRRRHHNPLHQFMLNLCLADLVVALFQVLPQLVWDVQGRFPGPDFLCRLVKYLQVLGMFASSYMIVAMTLDRHYAICCPLQAHHSGATQRCNSFVVSAWGLSLLLSLPQVFIFSRSEVAPGIYECWGNFAESWGLKAYVTWMTVSVFILPVLIITVCQVRIFREIHNNLYLKSERRLSPSSITASRRDSQRGGGARGKSSLPLHVSPLVFNNPGSQTSCESSCLPMGPVRSTSIPSFTSVHPAELQPDVLPDPPVPFTVCPPDPPVPFPICPPDPPVPFPICPPDPPVPFPICPPDPPVPFTVCPPDPPVPFTVCPPDPPVPFTICPPDPPVPFTVCPPDPPVPFPICPPDPPVPFPICPPDPPVPFTVCPPDPPVPFTICPPDPPVPF